jgi:hypothetical protein
VACGTCDAIARPDQDNIETAAAAIGHHLVESWPPGLGTTDLVGVLGDGLVATLSSHLTQVVQLCLGMLINSADAGVNRGALHARLLFF